MISSAINKLAEGVDALRGVLETDDDLLEEIEERMYRIEAMVVELVSDYFGNDINEDELGEAAAYIEVEHDYADGCGKA